MFWKILSIRRLCFEPTSIQTRSQIGSKIRPNFNPKACQNSSNVGPKSIQNRSKFDPKSVLGRLGSQVPKNDEKMFPRANLLRPLGRQVWGSWESRCRLLVAKLARLWDQSGAKVVNKIDPKLDRFWNASCDRFLFGFGWIWGARIEPSWHRNRIKNRTYIKTT